MHAVRQVWEHWFYPESWFYEDTEAGGRGPTSIHGAPVLGPQESATDWLGAEHCYALLLEPQVGTALPQAVPQHVSKQPVCFSFDPFVPDESSISSMVPQTTCFSGGRMSCGKCGHSTSHFNRLNPISGCGPWPSAFYKISKKSFRSPKFQEMLP